MKKTLRPLALALALATTALLPFSASALADRLPSEAVDYSGAGQWWDSLGNTGSYLVSARAEGNAFTTVYGVNGHVSAWSTSVVFLDQSNFAVYLSGQTTPIGYGACLGVTCSYALLSYDFTRESITFGEGVLDKAGSRVVNGVTIYWQERLEELRYGPHD